MRVRYLSFAAALSLVSSLAPNLAGANARLIAVTPLDGGCVAGPTGPAVQAWDVQPGKTYRLTISNVAECANGGTDATLNVRVQSSAVGNTDLVASLVAAGTYAFDFTLPLGSCETFPIRYCTTPGVGNSGIFVHRSDGGPFQAHLRAATFGAGCTIPAAIVCQPTAIEGRSWGTLKVIYR